MVKLADTTDFSIGAGGRETAAGMRSNSANSLRVRGDNAEPSFVTTKKV